MSGKVGHLFRAMDEMNTDNASIYKDITEERKLKEKLDCA